LGNRERNRERAYLAQVPPGDDTQVKPKNADIRKSFNIVIAKI
jgi:hypothetical protein